MPIAALVGIGWFFAFRIWPWLTEYLASRARIESEDRIAIATSLTNQSELIFSLVKAVTELRSTLTEMTSSLHRMNDEIGDIRLDIAALYADRPRPSRQQKQEQK